MIAIGPDDVIVTQTPVAGWAVATDGGETVALEVTITPELRREGLAREFIRLVQDARKGDGLEVTDRITVRWRTADPELAQALTEHQAMISSRDTGRRLRARSRPGNGGETGSGDLAGDGVGQLPTRQPRPRPHILDPARPLGSRRAARWRSTSGRHLSMCRVSASARGGLLRPASPARNAAGRLGCLPGHRLQVLRAQEPDQDAVRHVIPGDAWHYRDGALGLGGRGAGRSAAGLLLGACRRGCSP